MHRCSEYDHTKQIFVNSYPWLFPGGVGDIYDLEQGQIPIKEWGQHLLQYYDGQILEDPLFGSFLYNTIQRHTNNSKGNFFFKSDRFIGKNPPTVQELKKQLENKNTGYTNLGWEFQFLVPISGTPIGSGIQDPFPIPKIPVGKILNKFRC
jgi:hypothetical protein